MSDEQIIKAIAAHLAEIDYQPSMYAHKRPGFVGPTLCEEEAVDLLTALRDAGFDVYRPVRRIIWYCDECRKGAEFRSDLPCPHHDMLPIYRLVPVETPKEDS